jgi:hypothetical protein
MRIITTLLVLLFAGGCASSLISEDNGADTSYDELKNNKAMAVNIETGESFYVGGISVWDPVANSAKAKAKAKLSAISKCDKELKSQKSFNTIKVKGSKCKIFRINDEIIHRNVDDYLANIKMIEEAERRYKENQEYAQKQERLRQQELILTALVARCENFGWKDENYIASCVQQEAYRDLQLEKQKREIKILEQKLASAQNMNVDDEPLFFMFLDAYAQSKQRDNMLQMKKDIAVLKASSSYKGSSTEAALKSLYRTNN